CQQDGAIAVQEQRAEDEEQERKEEARRQSEKQEAENKRPAFTWLPIYQMHILSMHILLIFVCSLTCMFWTDSACPRLTRSFGPVALLRNRQSACYALKARQLGHVFTRPQLSTRAEDSKVYCLWASNEITFHFRSISGPVLVAGASCESLFLRCSI
ncbi:unnamed protein product, partial [Protopolystoma xenopodis]